MDASAFVAVGVIFLIVGVLIGSFATHQDEKRRRAKPDPVAAYSAQSALALAHECDQKAADYRALFEHCGDIERERDQARDDLRAVRSIVSPKPKV